MLGFVQPGLYAVVQPDKFSDEVIADVPAIEVILSLEVYGCYMVHCECT